MFMRSSVLSRFNGQTACLGGVVEILIGSLCVWMPYLTRNFSAVFSLKAETLRYPIFSLAPSTLVSIPGILIISLMIFISKPKKMSVSALRVTKN